MPIGPPSQRPEPKPAWRPGWAPSGAIRRCESAATGSLSTRSFHGLVVGKTGQPPAPGGAAANAAVAAADAQQSTIASLIARGSSPSRPNPNPRLPFVHRGRVGSGEDAAVDWMHG